MIHKSQSTFHELRKLHALQMVDAEGSPHTLQIPIELFFENSFFIAGLILSKPRRVEYIMVGWS